MGELLRRGYDAQIGRPQHQGIDEDDRSTRVICENFRSGQDYVPAIRSGDFFVFDDPEGSKADDGSPNAVVVNILSESEK